MPRTATRRFALFAVAALGLPALGPAVRAAPVATGSAKPAVGDAPASDVSYQTFFDSNISGTDLLQTAVSGTPTTTGTVSGGAFPNLYDGAASSKPYNNGTNDLSHDTFFGTGDLSGSPSISFTFTTPRNIGSIRSISGWGDTPTFGNQRYDIFLNGSSTAFFSVNYEPIAATGANADKSLNGSNNNTNGLNPNSTQVLVTDDAGGALATNVTSIKFVFLPNSSTNGAVYREIDVNAAVPEPASLGLLAAATLGLLARRRRST